MDVLSAEYQLPYNDYRKGGERPSLSDIFYGSFFGLSVSDADTVKVIIRRQATPSQPLVDFITKENQSPKHLETLKEEVKREIVRFRALSFGFYGAAIVFVVGFCRGCTAVTFPGGPKEDMGTWFGTFVFCAVVGAVIGGVIGSATEPSVRD